MLRVMTQGRPNSGSDHLAIAFVVDTVGRVELPTITVVIAPQNRQLVTSVCDALVNARFLQQTPAQRALVLQSFSFDVSRFVPAPPIPFFVDSTRERLRTMPRDKLFESLEAQPHCR